MTRDEVIPVRSPRRGLTLIELLVVLAVLGVLIALLLPAVQGAREGMRRAACLNNFKQLGIALQAYHDVQETFPPGYCSKGLTSDPGSIEVGRGWSWGAFILEGLDQVPLFNAINFESSVTDPTVITILQTNLGAFLCPSNSDQGPARPRRIGATNLLFEMAASQYVASAGLKDPEDDPESNNGIFYRNKSVGLRDVTDGASSTLALGELSKNLADAAWSGAVPGYIVCSNPSWPGSKACEPSALLVLGLAQPPGRAYASTPPDWPAARPGNFWSLHPGGANFLLADGSARFIKATVAAEVFAALATRAGSELVGEF